MLVTTAVSVTDLSARCSSLGIHTRKRDTISRGIGKRACELTATQDLQRQSAQPHRVSEHLHSARTETPKAPKRFKT